MNCRSTDQKGFAVLTLLLFLPILGLLVFALGLNGYLVQYKTRLRTRCIDHSAELEKTLVRFEEDLFLLNPPARLLRFRLRAARTALILAQASENYALVLELERQIAEIQLDQIRLDQTQKKLIQLAKQNLQIQTQRLQSDLSQQGREMQNLWGFYLQGFTQVRLTKIPGLAVVADSPDPAPVYELAQDFVEQQRVAYEWQHRFRTNSSAQTILSAESQLEMGCSVTARKEKQSWILEINADKF